MACESQRMVRREEKVKSLRAAVQLIAQDRGESTARAQLSGGLSAQAVGRNEVWRIQDERGEVFFAKRWKEPIAFQRELMGYKLALDLAEKIPVFMAADVMVADRQSGFIVTSGMKGKTASDLFREALRFDKNPVRRRDVIEEARRSIHSIVSWLKAFHLLAVDTDNVLYDHGPEEIVSRLNRKLRQAKGGASMGALLDIDGDLPLPEFSVDVGLIFGDATLGNFFFDGERVGAVDFEDVGVGPIQRDFSVLSDSIRGAMEGTLYYRDRKLLELIPGPSNPRLEEIIELEIHIFRFEQLLKRRNPLDVLRRRREKALIRDIAGSMQSMSS